MSNQPTFIKTDGGRQAAGYKGIVNDCAVRAIAIALELDYKIVYQQINLYLEAYGYQRTARQAVPFDILNRYLKMQGWEYVSAKRDELPAGRIIADIGNHVLAVIDGVVHDLWDSLNDGEVSVHGCWVKK